MKFLLEGGVDIGWWHHNDTTLISNGLVTSVKREASAEVPVIAICEELYQFIEKHDDRFNYAKDPIKCLFLEYKSDFQKFFYLDYIYLVLNNMDGTQKDDEYWLKEHARKIEKAAKKTCSPKVFMKYQWLANYHNKAALGFTQKEECFCHIGKQLPLDF